MNALHRRFLFVTGKGGVGKTTVSLAVATALAARGRRTLLATPEPTPYRHLLPDAAFSTDPTWAAENLWTVHLNAAEALQEYGRLLITARLARHALFGNRYVQTFMAAVPGLYPWAQLGKAWYHTTERRDGKARFDTVVFDAPATGHGLEMLRTPKALTEIAPAGVMRRDAELAWRMFQDPAQSGVVLVTLPEQLPTNETEELYRDLRDELGFPVSLLVVNRVRPQLFSPEARGWLTGLAEGPPNDPVARSLDQALGRAFEEEVQAQALTRLAALPTQLVRLPELPPHEASSASGVRQLASHLLTEPLPAG